MKKLIMLSMALCCTAMLYAQKSFVILVKDAQHGELLTGATVSHAGSGRGAVTGLKGEAVLQDLPDGEQVIRVSYLGYEPREITLLFPENFGKTIVVALSEGEELEEVMVSTTRTSRLIQDVPTRVEVIGLEEIDEKSNMRPSNVSMLLHESTGIQVQQTSATSANSSIRIQGLDGRYTQLLKDGYPNFGGFSSGLSILDLPPLDLKQVEVIKGSASTLYGGGAIAGVVNFVSKTPVEKDETLLLLNQSHIGASDVGAFLSRKRAKIGYTFLATYNRQKAYDVNNDDFTELPKTDAFTVSPRLFLYLNDSTTLRLGHTLIGQQRLGGDVFVIRNGETPEHSFFEENKSWRNLTTLEFETKLRRGTRLLAKQSLSVFDRNIAVPGYTFGGTQTFVFTDVSLLKESKRHVVMAGVNFTDDRFRENQLRSGEKRDQRLSTVGFYAQDTWDVSSKLSFENGLRFDYNPDFGAFLLPRVSMLYRWNSQWSSRLSGGLGYKLPTMFTEATEALAYQNVANTSGLSAEKSLGGTADVSFKTELAENLVFTLNQMVFYTRIEKPLILNEDVQGFFFENARQPVHSFGSETNAKFIYDPFKFFVGYTFTRAKATYATGNQTLPLTPENKLNLVLLYEVHGNVKIGIEGYYVDRQYLSNATYSPDYWEFGAFIEKTFGKFSVFLNAENFTDTRQSRLARVVEGSHQQPMFGEIFTHTEGRVLSGGVKIRL